MVRTRALSAATGFLQPRVCPTSPSRSVQFSEHLTHSSLCCCFCLERPTSLDPLLGWSRSLPSQGALAYSPSVLMPLSAQY